MWEKWCFCIMTNGSSWCVVLPRVRPIGKDDILKVKLRQCYRKEELVSHNKIDFHLGKVVNSVRTVSISFFNVLKIGLFYLLVRYDCYSHVEVARNFSKFTYFYLDENNQGQFSKCDTVYCIYVLHILFLLLKDKLRHHKIFKNLSKHQTKSG